MNFLNNKRYPEMKAIQILFRTTLLLLVVTACSEDEGNPEPYITTEPAIATFSNVNTCILPGNVAATTFFTTIKYEASKGTEINKVIVKSQWSNDQNSTWEAFSFTISNGELSFEPCYKFASTTWVKVSFTLVSNDGIKSNPSLVTINKPTGAF